MNKGPNLSRVGVARIVFVVLLIVFCIVLAVHAHAPAQISELLEEEVTVTATPTPTPVPTTRPTTSPPPTPEPTPDPTPEPTPEPAPEPPMYGEHNPYWYEWPFEETTMQRLREHIAIELNSGQFEEKCLIAQCILDRSKYCIGSDGTVWSTLTWPGQFPWYKKTGIAEDIDDVITAVFRDGYRVTDEPCIFFCNPKRASQSSVAWMEKKGRILETDNHRYYTDPRALEAWKAENTPQ